MKRYSLTSAKTEGDLVFEYNNNQLLCGFQCRAEVTDEQLTWILQRLPFTFAELQALAKQGRVLKEIPLDLSFETFYNLYAYKTGKLEAERAWKRLNEADKVKALERINKFKQFCNSKNTALPYPATYLNKRRFEDELR
ncbi:MAG: hypothetical protein AB7G44_03475 [Bacteroidia bacterium]